MASDQESGFLGTGWRYQLVFADMGIGLDGDGRIAEVSGPDVVHQSIWLILSTAIGERVSHPKFGCAIHDQVFAPISAATMGKLAAAVRRALRVWEPRIDLLDVRAEPSRDHVGLVEIEIHYLIRATNSRFNMVYPFYLMGPVES